MSLYPNQFIVLLRRESEKEKNGKFGKLLDWFCCKGSWKKKKVKRCGEDVPIEGVKDARSGCDVIVDEVINEVSCGNVPQVISQVDDNKWKKFSDYKMIRVLGEGGFGHMVLAEQNETKKLYAFKFLKKNSVKAFDLYENEKEVLKIATNQPFLIGYHACFQTPNNYIIAMDYACGGDLDNLIKYLGRIPEESTKFYVAELVLGVSFLHSKGIIHRDLKPENVMLDQDGHIRITDYGLCKRDFSYGEKTKERVGTLDYVAPEIWRGKSYDFRVDIWALGVTMYKMLTGRKPFDLPLKRNPWQSIRLIGKKALVRIPDSISDQACQVLQKFLAKKMENRLGSNPSTTIHSIASLRFFSSIDWKLLEARRVQPPYKPILPP
ncbi:unnamed protein product [Gordionus sp. m RMFG-2023]